jgi:HPt (histidine-containing phosphotransfer) domain-containing protein
MTTLMPPDQLHQLYAMCLQDVENRLDRMRIAASHHNEEIFRREAHSIKGGAGMLGAVEIQSLAAKLETQSPIPANHLASLNEILLAAERLRRILIAREDRAK